MQVVPVITNAIEELTHVSTPSRPLIPMDEMHLIIKWAGLIKKDNMMKEIIVEAPKTIFNI